MDDPTRAANLEQKTHALVALSNILGAEQRGLAILGEGNTSTRLSEETFLVKASGSSLGTLTRDDIVEARSAPLLAMLGRDDLSDQAVEDELFGARVDPAAKKPSIEALFHAYLLSLPGISFVGHTHPLSVNAILCTAQAPPFATHRYFPDEVVCCGPSSLLIPYMDPGLRLAQAIRKGVIGFMQERGIPPRVILLASHGVITLGATSQAVLGAMLMTDKAARIFTAAAALGGSTPMPQADVDRIANRLDEHYRQRALQL
jgi:rhamnose utilization protein RhaD (predicted bifunctional aldolase and dehydrogenase)